MSLRQSIPTAVKLKIVFIKHLYFLFMNRNFSLVCCYIDNFALFEMPEAELQLGHMTKLVSIPAHHQRKTCYIFLFITICLKNSCQK